MNNVVIVMEQEKKHAVDVMALDKFTGMFNSIVNSHVVSATARERLVALCVMAQGMLTKKNNKFVSY